MCLQYEVLQDIFQTMKKAWDTDRNARWSDIFSHRALIIKIYCIMARPAVSFIQAISMQIVIQDNFIL